MLGRIIDEIYHPDALLQENLDVAEGVMSSIFGGQDNAKKVFEKILPVINSFTDQDNSILINTLEKFKKIESFFDLIRFAANLDSETIEFTPRVRKVFEIFYANFKHHIPANVNDYSNVLIPGVLGEFVHSKKIFSIKEITDEFDVDQRTFLKWLQWFFGDKFNRRKKLTVIEYIEIHAAMLIYDKKRKFNFEKYAETYFKQLLERVVFRKRDLAEFIETDLKTLTKNLTKRYPGYPHIDKIPWSLAKEFKKVMG